MSPSPPRQILLLTRPGCHLCDDAAHILSEHHVAFDSINIDDHPTLRERYGECIPVVIIEGRERFRGHINPVLLQRLLR